MEANQIHLQSLQNSSMPTCIKGYRNVMITLLLNVLLKNECVDSKDIHSNVLFSQKYFFNIEPESLKEIMFGYLDRSVFEHQTIK